MNRFLTAALAIAGLYSTGPNITESNAVTSAKDFGKPLPILRNNSAPTWWRRKKFKQNTRKQMA